jgi:membrane protein YdbS with pleckstrin-like domain
MADDANAPDPIPQQEQGRGDNYWEVEDEPDDVPREIRRFLIPAEKRVLFFRYHPASMAGHAAICLSVWVILISFNVWRYRHIGPGEAQVIRLLLLAVSAWYGYYALEYRHSWIVITPVRILTIHGLIGKKVNPLPMRRITDMQMSQSPLGRLLKYGTLSTESLHTEHALAEIRFVPSPDFVFSTMWDVLLPQRAVSPMPGENF